VAFSGVFFLVLRRLSLLSPEVSVECYSLWWLSVLTWCGVRFFLVAQDRDLVFCSESGVFGHLWFGGLVSW